MPRRVRLTQEQQQRRHRWLTHHVPYIQEKATRPNATYIDTTKRDRTTTQLVEVLQHFVNGIQQVLMARPIAPFQWLADYMRHAVREASLSIVFKY